MASLRMHRKAYRLLAQHLHKAHKEEGKSSEGFDRAVMAMLPTLHLGNKNFNEDMFISAVYDGKEYT